MRVSAVRLTAAGAALAAAALLLVHSLPSTAQTAPAGGPPAGPVVTVAKPIVREVQETQIFTGRFDATQSVTIKSRVPGYLLAAGFADGAFVKKGDLLFTVDPRPYKAAVDQAKAAVSVSDTTLQFAQSDLDRALQLQKTGNITDQTFDQRRQALLQAQARSTGDKAALQAADLNLEFTEIRAPFDGRMSRALVSEGTLVGAADTSLATIVAADPIDFYFELDEGTFLTLERALAESGAKGSLVGTAVTVGTSDEAEPKRAAVIDFVDNRVDQASGTMRLRARVPNGDLFLTPGLFGRVRIPVGGPKQGVLVPDEAIASDQTRRIVYLAAEDGSVTPKPVTVGPKIDGYRLVRSGLDGSETIVINGLVRIRPGVKVTPKATTLPSTAQPAK
ncbi:MAG: efflux RND transporter periplasmic adaptor subunit [Phyllobacteriaceae bacterium]|nr:efflux RND transporter periplasmic adaptor subunit [Phyllobacteriaceae bacterium]